MFLAIFFTRHSFGVDYSIVDRLLVLDSFFLSSILFQSFLFSFNINVISRQSFKLPFYVRLPYPSNCLSEKQSFNSFSSIFDESASFSTSFYRLSSQVPFHNAITRYVSKKILNSFIIV